MHQIGALATGIPELSLGQDEAQILAVRIVDLNKHFDLALLSPKALSVVAMISAVGMIYGPRVVIIVTKGRKPKQAKPPIDPRNDPEAFLRDTNGVGLNG